MNFELLLNELHTDKNSAFSIIDKDSFGEIKKIISQKYDLEKSNIIGIIIENNFNKSSYLHRINNNEHPLALIIKDQCNIYSMVEQKFNRSKTKNIDIKYKNICGRYNEYTHRYIEYTDINFSYMMFKYFENFGNKWMEKYFC